MQILHPFAGSIQQYNEQLPYGLLPCVPVYPATGSQNLTCDILILSAETAAAQLALTLG